MIANRATSALTRVNAPALATQDLLQSLAGAPLPGWPEFSRQVRLTKIRRGESVFHQGEAHPFAHVVRRGLIKNVYLREAGDAWIKSFTHERGFIASVAALKPGGLTSFSAVCIEDSDIECVPYDLVEQFAARDLLWSTAIRKAMTLFAERKEQRERDLLVLSPEERYRSLLQELPEIERRVSQKDLAAYIGVTPVGLNRIVKRVKS